MRSARTPTITGAHIRRQTVYRSTGRAATAVRCNACTHWQALLPTIAGCSKPMSYMCTYTPCHVAFPVYGSTSMNVCLTTACPVSAASGPRDRRDVLVGSTCATSTSTCVQCRPWKCKWRHWPGLVLSWCQVGGRVGELPCRRRVHCSALYAGPVDAVTALVREPSPSTWHDVLGVRTTPDAMTRLCSPLQPGGTVGSTRGTQQHRTDHHLKRKTCHIHSYAQCHTTAGCPPRWT